MTSPTSTPEDTTIIVNGMCGGIESISVALNLKSLANVLSSTAPGAESNSVPQWLLLWFLLLASKVVPCVHWRVMVYLNGHTMVSFASIQGNTTRGVERMGVSQRSRH
jgi:hypothetical protein